jgi:hypothetical protein
VSLADRVALAAQAGAAFFVSIHHNGLPAGVANRTESYWCRLSPACADEDECRRPAQLLHDRVVAAFGHAGRGALEDSAGSGRFHFYVLERASMPAALVEASNISGDLEEESRFGRDPAEAHARAEALALHAGILLGALGYPAAVEPAAPAGRGAGGPAVHLDLAPPGAGGAVVVRLSAPGVVGDLALDLVDLLGRRRRRLFAGRAPIETERAWDGRDDGDRPLPAGLFWLVASIDGRIVASRRVIRLP